MKKTLTILLILIFSLSIQSINQKAVKPNTGFSALDTLRVNRLSSPILPDDGKWILFTKSTIDLDIKEKKRITHIWKVNVDGTDIRQMTFGKTNCTSPSWIENGKKIAFLSSRNKDKKIKGNQVFMMFSDGGEARQVTKVKEGIYSYDIFRNQILYITKNSLTKEEEKNKKEKNDAVIVDKKIRFRHLWIHNIVSSKNEQITKGNFLVSDAHWSPDGQKIVYVRAPNSRSNDRWDRDIYVFDLKTKTSKLLYKNPGPDTNPRWSPNGKSIAFSTEAHGTSTTWLKKLAVIPSIEGKVKIHLNKFDRDFSRPIWSNSGKSIYWGAGDKTTRCLFRVNLKTGNIKKIKPMKGSLRSWFLSKKGNWVWTFSSPNEPAEIFTSNGKFTKIKRLTNANPWIKKEKKRLSSAITIQWKNSDGQVIEGVLTYPVDYKPGQKYPLILNPHGGPSGARVESFSTYNQFFASNGFMILQPNFRGSVNYGQEFVNANRQNWGIHDYDDCMTGVDHCIKEGLADPDRLICYGWSYGGYLSFWIATQTSRFKAISPGAGLPNLYSMYGTNDIPGYLEWFLDTPWNNPEIYDKLSPIRHVKSVKTPVLIMHGGNDKRVPLGQAQEFYRALIDLKKEVIMVTYPREGHGIRETNHHLDRLRRYLHFFTKHTNTEPVTDKEFVKKIDEEYK